MKLSISRQLLVGVIISSALITTFVTAAHLYRDYVTQIEFISQKFDALMQTNKEALETSIWDINDKQIESILNGLKALDTLDQVRLKYERADGEAKKVIGQAPLDPLEKTYRLSYEGRDIGSIQFRSSREHVYTVLWDELGTLFFLNLIKTFIASFLILYIINFLLTRHLLRITDHLKAPNLRSLRKVTLNKRWPCTEHDELDLLCSRINELLHTSQQTTQTLEKMVQKRTEQLDKQLKVLSRVQFALDQISLFATVDSNGDIRTFNEKFQEMFQIENHKLVGKPFASADYFLEDDVSFIRGLLDARRNWKGEIQCRENGDNLVWYMLSIIPDNAINLDDSTYTIIASDITARKRQQGELEKARKQAEESALAKASFLANMSHEIRTPMNGILGVTEQLMYDIHDPKLRKQLKIVQSCGSSLLRLINDILDFSKIEASKLELESIPVSIEQAVYQVKDLLKQSAIESGNTISFKVEDNVPKWILGDPTRLKQIITNLLGNAIKFTRKGHISIHVCCSKVSQQRHTIQFSITDSGIGISPAAQEQLFQAFTQEDLSTSRKFGGTGLGLAICKAIVEEMQGKIWLKSCLGTGSTFSFNFPARITEAPLQNESLEQGELALCAQTHPLSLLIAEDNEINLKVLKGFLKRLGYQADSSCNGLDALQMANKKQYDVILMDCQMPVMDGYEASQKIQLLKKPPVIIALTASTLVENRERCLSLGMSLFLTKPIRLKSLKEALIEVQKIISDEKGNRQQAS